MKPPVSLFGSFHAEWPDWAKFSHIWATFLKDLVCCRYWESSERGNIDVKDFKIELFMNILSKYLDWQLFGLLFQKFGRIFFQSSGHSVFMAVLQQPFGHLLSFLRRNQHWNRHLWDELQIKLFWVKKLHRIE